MRGEEQAVFERYEEMPIESSIAYHNAVQRGVRSHERLRVLARSGCYRHAKIVVVEFRRPHEAQGLIALIDDEFEILQSGDDRSHDPGSIGRVERPRLNGPYCHLTLSVREKPLGGDTRPR